LQLFDSLIVDAAKQSQEAVQKAIAAAGVTALH
jgi:hypothetical protein